MVTEGLTE